MRSLLEGKTVIITGGGRGLGKGMAEAVAQQGGSVAIVGRQKATLESAAAYITQETNSKVSVHVADVSQADQIDRVVDEVIAEHGSIHGLVNNAGVADEAAFEEITEECWRNVVDVNLTAPFLFSQRVVPEMSSGGSIVNIASVDAHGADGPFASYVAAKAGLIGLTKAAAAELGKKSIRVNSVSPGWTYTDMVEEAVEPDVLYQMVNNFTRAPLGRMTEVEEIAHGVAFLLSDAASGITGIDMPIDGGTLANLYILETLSDRQEKE